MLPTNQSKSFKNDKNIEFGLLFIIILCSYNIIQIKYGLNVEILVIMKMFVTLTILLQDSNSF